MYLLTENTAWEYKAGLVTHTAFRTRDDRLENLAKHHNAIYLKLLPMAKKPQQPRESQQDMSTQKLNQMDQAIEAITQQFHTTEHHHETLFIIEDEAFKIKGIIANENPEPSTITNEGS